MKLTYICKRKLNVMKENIQNRIEELGKEVAQLEYELEFFGELSKLDYLKLKLRKEEVCFLNELIA